MKNYAWIVLLLLTAASVQADIIYDVTFENPPHTVGSSVVTGIGAGVPSDATLVTVVDSPGDFTSQAAGMTGGSVMTFSPGVTTAGVVLYSWDYVLLSLSGSLPLMQSGIDIYPDGGGISLQIDFLSSQDVRVTTPDGQVSNIATFTLGVGLQFAVTADLDNDLMSLSIDGTPLIVDQALPTGWNPTDVKFQTGLSASPTYAIDNFSLEVVPEPSTAALLACAATVMASVLRRRQRS